MRQVLQLTEDIAVVKGLLTHVRIIMHLPWQLAVVVVIVELAAEPVEGIGIPHEVQLAVACVHLAVRAPLFYHLITILQLIRVIVLRIGVFADGREGKLFGKALLIADKGTEIAERPSLQLCRQMRAAVSCRHTDCLHIQHCRGCGVAGRDEDIVVVADDQRELVHIVETIAREVYLATLAVTEHDAVVAHTRVLRAKTTHRDRLHAPCPTIVAQGDARDAMQRIGHIRHTQTEHLSTIDDMKGSRTRHHMLPATLRNGYLTKLMRPVRNGIITNLLPVRDMRQQAGHHD